MAKVDPFVVQWPRAWMADDEIRPVIEYLNRYLHDLFIRTGGGDDAIESLEEVSAAEADTSRLFATIRRLERRVQDLEESNDNEVLNSRISKLNQKVNKLIADLIAAVEANAPDRELEHKVLCIQQQTLKEIELLSARVEEAFETEIEADDL